jgi:hypothetical protein
MRIEVLRGAGLDFHHDKSGVHSSTDQGGGKRRAGIAWPRTHDRAKLIEGRVIESDD